jgi:hypothetical protein
MASYRNNFTFASFPSALQLKVSSGLLNNLPPFFDAMVDGCLGKRHFPLPVLLVPCRLTLLTQQTKGPIAESAWIQISLMSISVQSIQLRLNIRFLNNLVFMVWGCCLTPNLQLGGPGYPSSSGSLSGMDGPSSSYATTSIALRVSRALKPHHHDKAETPSVWNFTVTLLVLYKACWQPVGWCRPVGVRTHSRLLSLTR